MIYTLTLNPAIDMNIKSKNIIPNTVQRTEGAVYSPNGKGVNVSIVLKKNGIDSVILGYFGGFSGDYILEEINKLDIKSSPLYIQDTTRINVFIHDGLNEYKFVSPGGFVDKESQNNLIRYIDKNIIKDDHLVISGSLPPGIENEFYHQILSLCNKKGIHIILDISSPCLKELLKYKPYLIKPNDDELKEIFNFNLENEENIEKALLFLNKEGVKNTLLTMGSKGLYFFDGKELYYANAPKINLLSSACSGDSCLAAFLSEFLLNRPVEYALKKASATGANVAENEGIGILNKVDDYIKQINVRKIEVIYE